MKELQEVSILREMKEKYSEYFNPGILLLNLFIYNRSIYIHWIEEVNKLVGDGIRVDFLNTGLSCPSSELEDVKYFFINRSSDIHFCMMDFLFNTSILNDNKYHLEPWLKAENYTSMGMFPKMIPETGDDYDILGNVKDIYKMIICRFSSCSKISKYRILYYKYILRLENLKRLVIIEKENHYILYAKNPKLFQKMMSFIGVDG